MKGEQAPMSSSNTIALWKKKEGKEKLLQEGVGLFLRGRFGGEQPSGDRSTRKTEPPTKQDLATKRRTYTTTPRERRRSDIVSPKKSGERGWAGGGLSRGS